MKISLSEACALTLEQWNNAVVTEYDLWLMICRLFVVRQLGRAELNIRVRIPENRHLTRTVKALRHARILNPDPDFGSQIFRFTNSPDHTPEELACYVDPFCYVSHLSAMGLHGLTDRVPSALTITSPSRQLWRLRAEDKRNQDFKDFPEYMATHIIWPFPRYKMPKKIRGRLIEAHESRFLGASERLRSPAAAISTIGQTFLDMLAAPQLCGGMRHVIDVWDNEFEAYVEEVITCIDADERPIVKVRAGYLITEKFGISDDRVENWKSFAQRGGSRKLDPIKPYLNKWSEDWQISLNL